MGKYDGIKPPFPIEQPQINIKPGPPACPRLIPKCNPKPAIGYPKQKPPYIVEIDPTFTKTGAAADAKLTGELVNSLKEEISENYYTKEETDQKIQYEFDTLQINIIDGNGGW